MTTSFKLLLAASIALASPGCAHGPSALVLRARADAPVWPPPPASPRVRWVTSWPARPSDAAGRGWLERTVDAIVGVDPARSQRLLSRPFGIAVQDGEMLVADPDGRQVVLVDLRTGEASALACPSREWVSPMAVAFGEARARYVADPGAGLIARLEGNQCRELGAGMLERPTGLAFVGGRLFAVDPPRHRVAVLSPEGIELLSFGARGDADGQLNFPTAVSTAPDGSLLVVDSLNFRVTRFSGGGAFLGAFGEPGDGPGEFSRPKAVAVDLSGRIYVSDSTLDQVLVFDRAGAFLHAIGSSGSGDGSLLMPAGLAIADRFLYVADSLNGRVAIYEILGDAS